MIQLYIYTYLFFFQILLPIKLLQNIKQGSQCYTISLCWLSILNIWGPYWKVLSPGDSLSDNPEELLQRGKGGVRIHILIFHWGKKLVVEHQKSTANQKNRHLKLMVLVLFNVWEMARIWGHPNFSSDVHHNYLGQYPEHRVLPIFLHFGGCIVLGDYNGWWLDPGKTGMAGNFPFFTEGKGGKIIRIIKYSCHFPIMITKYLFTSIKSIKCKKY